MSERTPSAKTKSALRMRLLDQCVDSIAGLRSLQAIVNKIERCCTAAEKGISLADVLNDAANLASLRKAFGGDADLGLGMQIILKVALSGHSCRSLTLTHAIEGARKMEFLRQTLGGWKQFDVVIAFQSFESGAKSPDRVHIVNPASSADWKAVGAVPAGTLVTAYVRTAGKGKRQNSQEELALDRVMAALEVVQGDVAPVAAAPAPRKVAAPAARPAPRKAAPVPAAPAFKARASSNVTRISSASRTSRAGISTAGEPSFSFQVVINKMDTFVHAGNAQLILGHLQKFPGKCQLYVLRGEKHKVQMDADSIWSAEIRNGETVLFEFFGGTPDDAFIRELAKKTNKYTQMDKAANE